MSIQSLFDNFMSVIIMALDTLRAQQKELELRNRIIVNLEAELTETEKALDEATNENDRVLEKYSSELEKVKENISNIANGITSE